MNEDTWLREVKLLIQGDTANKDRGRARNQVFYVSSEFLIILFTQSSKAFGRHFQLNKIIMYGT
jgi:hypothetical protein